MLKKIGIVVGYILLFATIVVAVVYAHIGADDHRNTQAVTTFDIHIDGADSHALVDVESMYEWFTRHDVNPLGKSIAEIDLAALEQVALTHSAIADVNAYITYDGRVDVTLTQREPIARLRVNGGYDHYISNDGYLFKAKDGYAVYVPIITGNYKPLIDKAFTGNLKQHIEDSIASLGRHIEMLEHDKYPFFRERKKLKNRNDDVQDSVIKKPFWLSEDEIKRRESDLKMLKKAYQQKFEVEDKKLAHKIEELDKRQEQLRDKVKTLNEIKADYMRFAEFVKSILDDSFWSAEITQIVLSTGDNEAICVGLVPRSGSFFIDLGNTHDLKKKLHNVSLFYEKVLRNVGWDKYHHISVRYDNQVVCKPTV